VDSASLVPAVSEDIPSPSSEAPEPGEVSEDEISPFDKRVNNLMAMIAEDPSVRDRVLCELYVTIAEFSDEFRAMQAQINSVGPAGFMKMIFGRRGKEEE